MSESKKLEVCRLILNAMRREVKRAGLSILWTIALQWLVNE